MARNTGFHIHIDASVLLDGFEAYLTKELGFWRTDFSGHPEGAEGFEPANHLTQKTASSKDYKSLWEAVLAHAKTPGAMKGYIEGEFIALDEDIAEKPFDPAATPPFKIKTTFLPAGSFRESEIHIAMDRDRSDPRLLKQLMEMGLFAAYLPKSYGTAEIFTAQGTKRQIQTILPPLIDYLEKTGGSVRCSIKEERVADWWMSSPDLRLPPVIASIDTGTTT